MKLFKRLLSPKEEVTKVEVDEEYINKSINNIVDKVKNAYLLYRDTSGKDYTIYDYIERYMYKKANGKYAWVKEDSKKENEIRAIVRGVPSGIELHTSVRTQGEFSAVSPSSRVYFYNTLESINGITSPIAERRWELNLKWKASEEFLYSIDKEFLEKKIVLFPTPTEKNLNEIMMFKERVLAKPSTLLDTLYYDGFDYSINDSVHQDRLKELESLAAQNSGYVRRHCLFDGGFSDFLAKGYYYEDNKILRESFHTLDFEKDLGMEILMNDNQKYGLLYALAEYGISMSRIQNNQYVLIGLDSNIFKFTPHFNQPSWTIRTVLPPQPLSESDQAIMKKPVLNKW